VSHNFWKSVQRLFSVPVDDADLANAEFRAFAQQIPLLYFILATNTIAVSSIYAKFGHPWISNYIPGCLCIFFVARAIKWWRLRRTEIPYETKLRLLRTTNKLAFFRAVAATVWDILLFPHGDP